MATLSEIFTNIANAIRSKKGTTDKILPSNMPTEIESIQTGGGDNPLQTLVTGRGENGGFYLCQYYNGDNADFLVGVDFSTTTNMKYMFNNCTNLTTIPQLDTSNVTNMSFMFWGCSNLTTIPQLDTSNVTAMNSMFKECYNNLTTIPQLDTSKVTDMSYMFYQCRKLITIPQLDTSNVTSMNYMFQNCSKLTTIPQLDTSNVTSMNSVFRNCYNLATIDITQFKPSSASTGSSFALACYSLTKFIIRTMDTIPTFGTNMFSGCYHFDGTVDSTYNPNGLKDGRIYVPDAQVDNLKAATGWADFAEIIVPLSTLVE